MASLKKLILHGRFKELYPDDYAAHVESAGELLESFQAQIDVFKPELGQDPHCGKLVGFETKEEIYAPTDQEEIHLVPTVQGAKKGGLFQIIIGVVLIAVSFIPGLNVAVAAVLLSSGVGLALGGVVNLLMPAPSLETGEDPEASKYLGAEGNTVKMGTRIPLMYGTGPAYGHILSFNVDSTAIIRGDWPVTGTWT